MLSVSTVSSSSSWVSLVPASSRARAKKSTVTRIIGVPSASGEHSDSRAMLRREHVFKVIKEGCQQG